MGEAPTMITVRSRGGVPIWLTDERWRHVAAGHPELIGQRPRILETVADPDLIQRGDAGELLAVRFYEQTPATQKYLVVAYREIGHAEGFVVTAYFTRRPSAQRSSIWTR